MARLRAEGKAKRGMEDQLRERVFRQHWDTVWANAMLLVIAGLVYSDFSDACRDGFSERVASCIQSFMVMFQVFMHPAGIVTSSTSISALTPQRPPSFPITWPSACI